MRLSNRRIKKMSQKPLALILATSASLLAGCASNPDYTPEQLAHGVKIRGFHANIPLKSDEYSRPHQIAHAFGIRVNDLAPEAKNIMSASQQGAMKSFINGTVNDGLAVGLGAAAISTISTSVAYVRTEFDEWDAILDPTGFATIYDAQAAVLDGAADRTAKALRKQGYEVRLTAQQADGGNGELGPWIENRLTLINTAKGCPKPANDADASCQVKLRTLYYNAASREAPPKWLSDLNEAFIIRGIGLLTEGETSEGKSFALSREDREAIGREAGDGYYFYGAYDSSHAGFVGENGKVAYCHLVADKLKCYREEMSKSTVERVTDGVIDHYQKNWEERGIWGILNPRDID